MLIAIPSKGRAWKTTSNKLLPNIGTFFVPQSEFHQYEGTAKQIVSVPNDIIGITQTRNWILRNTDEKWVVFIDDDVRFAGYTKLCERHSEKIEIKSEKFWQNQFLYFFDLCEQLGMKIWGVKTESAPRGVYPYKPILFKTYVTASCMGIINDGEYLFNESFKVKEDYEICLRHIKNKGGILGVRYLHWENKHWADEGGCKDYRTIDMEREMIKKLIKMYPGMISKIKRKASQFTIHLTL